MERGHARIVDIEAPSMCNREREILWSAADGTHVSPLVQAPRRSQGLRVVKRSAEIVVKPSDLGTTVQRAECVIERGGQFFKSAGSTLPEPDTFSLGVLG